jgi:hypothetical protein
MWVRDHIAFELVFWHEVRNVLFINHSLIILHTMVDTCRLQ